MWRKPSLNETPTNPADGDARARRRARVRCAYGLFFLVTLGFGYWCLRSPRVSEIAGTISVRDSGVRDGFVQLGRDEELGEFQLELSTAKFAFVWGGYEYPIPRDTGMAFHGTRLTQALPNGDALFLLNDNAVIASPGGRQQDITFSLPADIRAGKPRALDVHVNRRLVTFLIASQNSNTPRSALVSYDLTPSSAASAPNGSAKRPPSNVVELDQPMIAGWLLGDDHGWFGIEQLLRDVSVAHGEYARLAGADGMQAELPVGFAMVMEFGNKQFFAAARRDGGFELARLDVDSLAINSNSLSIEFPPWTPPAVMASSPDGQWLLLKVMNFHSQAFFGLPRRVLDERLVLIDVATWSIAAAADHNEASFRNAAGNHFLSARFSEDSQQLEVATLGGKIATVDIRRWVDSTNRPKP